MLTNVSNIKPGSRVYFHGHPCIVLEHRAEGTLLITEKQIVMRFGNTNNFAESPLCEYLNGDFLNRLTDSHPEEALTRTIDLTALNGSQGYGHCECKVAPLTFDEVRRFHGLLPKPKIWEWSATPWSTPCVDEDDTWVMGLYADGSVGNIYCNDTHGSRPAFLIDSNLNMLDDRIAKKKFYFTGAFKTLDALDNYTTDELIAEVKRRTHETN